MRRNRFYLGLILTGIFVSSITAIAMDKTKPKLVIPKSAERNPAASDSIPGITSTYIESYRVRQILDKNNNIVCYITASNSAISCIKTDQEPR